jgi:hypothetical protein
MSKPEYAGRTFDHAYPYSFPLRPPTLREDVEQIDPNISPRFPYVGSKTVDGYFVAAKWNNNMKHEHYYYHYYHDEKKYADMLIISW